MRVRGALHRGKRISLLALASLSLLPIAQAGAKPSRITAALRAILRSVDGIYGAQTANLQGLGPAEIGISLHRRADGSQSGLRLVLLHPPGWSEARPFAKVHYQVLSVQRRGKGLRLTATAELPHSLGRIVFTIYVAPGHGARLVLHDQLGSAALTLGRLGPFVYRGLAHATAGSPYLGTWTVSMPGLDTYRSPGYPGACAQINPSGTTSPTLTIVTAAPDGFGGLTFGGSWSGPIPYLPGPGPYPVLNAPPSGGEGVGAPPDDVADYWAGMLVISATYSMPSSFSVGSYRFSTYWSLVLSSFGWNPPAQPSVPSWQGAGPYELYQFSPWPGQCQNAGGFTITGR